MWNQETKDKWVKIMQAHQDADALMQGQWFNGDKGCFFGCAMQTDEEPLEKATKEMGLPIWLVYLAERNQRPSNWARKRRCPERGAVTKREWETQRRRRQE